MLFLSSLTLSEDFSSSWGQPKLYVITNDYEEVSAILLARYLLNHFEIFSYALFNSRYFYSSVELNSNVLSDMFNSLGLRVSLSLSTEDFSFSLEIAAKFLIFSELLNSPGFSTSRINLYEDDFFQVCYHFPIDVNFSLNCTVSLTNLKINDDLYTDSKQPFSPLRVTLYLELNSFKARLLSEENACEFDENNGVFLPLGRDVQVQRIVHFDLRDSEKEIFLTQYNCTQRAMGYQLFLPKNWREFVQYYSLAYGLTFSGHSISMVETNEDGQNSLLLPQQLVGKALSEFPSKLQSCLEDLLAMIAGTKSSFFRDLQLIKQEDYSQAYRESIKGSILSVKNFSSSFFTKASEYKSEIDFDLPNLSTNSLKRIGSCSSRPATALIDINNKSSAKPSLGSSPSRNFIHSYSKRENPAVKISHSAKNLSKFQLKKFHTESIEANDKNLVTVEKNPSQELDKENNLTSLNKTNLIKKSDLTSKKVESSQLPLPPTKSVDLNKKAMNQNLNTKEKTEEGKKENEIKSKGQKKRKNSEAEDTKMKKNKIMKKERLPLEDYDSDRTIDDIYNVELEQSSSGFSRSCPEQKRTKETEEKPTEDVLVSTPKLKIKLKKSNKKEQNENTIIKINSKDFKRLSKESTPEEKPLFLKIPSLSKNSPPKNSVKELSNSLSPTLNKGASLVDDISSLDSLNSQTSQVLKRDSDSDSEFDLFLDF